jgi:hypothetical protein
MVRAVETLAWAPGACTGELCHEEQSTCRGRRCVGDRGLAFDEGVRDRLLDSGAADVHRDGHPQRHRRIDRGASGRPRRRRSVPAHHRESRLLGVGRSARRVGAALRHVRLRGRRPFVSEHALPRRERRLGGDSSPRDALLDARERNARRRQSRRDARRPRRAPRSPRSPSPRSRRCCSIPSTATWSAKTRSR